MGDVAIDIVLNYMESIPIIENKHDPLYEKCFIKKWASMQIIEAINNHPTLYGINIIEDFIISMEMYMRDSESDEMKKHFKIAQETAEEIILRFV